MNTHRRWPPTPARPIFATLHLGIPSPARASPDFSVPSSFWRHLASFSFGVPHGRRLLLAAALFGLPIVFNTGTRFLIPAAPCLALAIAMAVADTRFAVPALMIVHGIASWPDVADMYCDRYAPRIDEFPIQAVVNSKAALEYLHEKLGASWDMAQILDKRIPPGGRVFCYACPAQAYTLRDISLYYTTLESRALGDMLWTPMETGASR